MDEGRRGARFRRLMCAALLPATALTTTGCTTVLWTAACQSRAVLPEVAGMVRHYPAGVDRSLVVLYRARGDGTDVDLVVPLDAAGRPAEPFRPHGGAFIVRYPDGTDGGPVAGRVPTEQLTALLAQASTPATDRDALRPHWSAADWQPVHAAAIDRPLEPTGTERRGTACLLAYRFDEAGQVVPVQIPVPDAKAEAVVLPAGTRLVLVPESVDRPPGDQGRDQAVAVVLTPVAVAGDAAGTGIAIGVLGACLGIAIVALPFIVAYDLGRDSKPDAPATRPSAPPPRATPVTVPVRVEGEPDEGAATAAATAGTGSEAPGVLRR